MPVSILLITHNGVGATLLEAATQTYGSLPLPAQVISIDYNADLVVSISQLRQTIKVIDYGEGVLVLTDVLGATPSNLAQAISADESVYIVAGLNLPMLLSIMEDPKLDLMALAQKALSSGRDGVCQCACSNQQQNI